MDSKYSLSGTRDTQGQGPPPTRPSLDSRNRIIQAKEPSPQDKEIYFRRQGQNIHGSGADRNIDPPMEQMRATTHKLTANLSDRSDKQSAGGNAPPISSREPFFQTSVGCPGYRFLHGSPSIGEIAPPASIYQKTKRNPFRARKRPDRYTD